jgi:hypothetical protein
MKSINLCKSTLYLTTAATILGVSMNSCHGGAVAVASCHGDAEYRNLHTWSEA